MSEHDISLVTGQASTVIAENQKTTLGQAASALTPATLTAMIGINQGSALCLAPSVANVVAQLQTISANVADANSAAATATLSSLTSFHTSMGFGSSPNHAAFGSFFSQLHGHIQDSQELRKASDFMANMNYSDLGPGITDMGSAADRGMSNALGSLPAAGALMQATGTMYNGGDVKDFGSSLGLVKSLTDNKLANATGVNRRLADAGVPIDDLDNPIYADKINQVMSGITDPSALSVVADQFDVAPEIAATESTGDSNADAILAELQDIITRANNWVDWVHGTAIPLIQSTTSLAEYTAIKPTILGPEYQDFQQCFTDANNISKNEISPLPDDAVKLQLVNFRNNDVESALNSANAASTDLTNAGKTQKNLFASQAGTLVLGNSTSAADSLTTTGFSTPSTAMGASLSPGQSLPSLTGGIQNLKDLGDPTKLADPSAIAGLTGGVSGLTSHLTDIGAGTLKDAGAAGSLFNQIQSVQTPLHTAAFPSLNSLITKNQPTLNVMTGSGSGPLGLPNMTDFTQHLAGGPSITSFLKTVTTDAASAIALLSTSIAGAVNLITNVAGVDLTSPPPNTLGTSMSFAKSLHKFGADTSGSGVSDILHNLANTATPGGEAIKASLAEGKNNKLLADNGIPPVQTTPPPPEPGATNVAYPITVSRDFQRTSGGTVTIEAIANSSTDNLWRIINGSEASSHGWGPYAVMFTGTYDVVYATVKANPNSSDPTQSAYTILQALPQMKAELDSQMSGKSPQGLG